MLTLFRFFTNTSQAEQVLPINRPELVQLTPALKALDVWRYYQGIVQQIDEINKNTSTHCPESYTLFYHHRFSVQQDGLLRLSMQYEDEVRYTSSEARRIACAIYHLAYADTQNLERTHPFVFQQIANTLMRPFFYLHATDEVRTVHLHLHALIRRTSKKLSDACRFALQDELTEKFFAAVKLQRAYRAYCFKKLRPQSEPSSEWLGQMMDAHFIPRAPKEPAAWPGLSFEQKRAWSDAFKHGETGLGLRLSVYLIHYRSHKKFMAQLRHVIEGLNTYLFSLPKAARDYAFVVPYERHVKSNHWVLGLALPFCVKAPLAILYPHEVNLFHQDYPDLKHLVYLDDALYSGRQLANLASETKTNLHRVRVVPFYTQAGIRRFSSVFHHDILGEEMLTPQLLARVEDKLFQRAAAWTNEDNEKLDELLPPGYWDPASERAGTFFNHKVADDASTFLNSIERMHEHGESIGELPKIYGLKPY